MTGRPRGLGTGVPDGEPREIPAGSFVRPVAKGSTVSRLAWGDSTGASLRVPIEALRDGDVWVRTENCDGVEGAVPLTVCAEVEAYWRRGGTVSGEGTTTLRGGAGSSDRGVRPIPRGSRRSPERTRVTSGAFRPSVS